VRCFSVLSSGLTPPTPPPPVIRPLNAAADHQFVGAQLYWFEFLVLHGVAGVSYIARFWGSLVHGGLLVTKNFWNQPSRASFSPSSECAQWSHANQSDELTSDNVTLAYCVHINIHNCILNGKVLKIWTEQQHILHQIHWSCSLNSQNWQFQNSLMDIIGYIKETHRNLYQGRVNVVDR